MSLEVIEPPSKEVLEKIRSEFGLNEQRVREAIEHLKNWIELQPHLPKEIVSDKGRLERWLIRCKNSTEKVKKTLDLYYTLRTNVPDVMTGWDTEGDWFKYASNTLFCVPMRRLTPDCDRVIVAGLLTSDSANFNTQHILKLFQMMIEIRISEDYCRSDIYVFDYANISLGHLPKITPSYLKKFELCVLGGYNARVKAIHVLNAPPFTEALTALIKSIFKSKLAQRVAGNQRVEVSCLAARLAAVEREFLLPGNDVRDLASEDGEQPPYGNTTEGREQDMLRDGLGISANTIQVHGSDLTSFYEQVPKEILPTEYGGNCGSVAENWELWKKKIESYRDVFLERENHRSDESKRPGHSITSSDLLGFEGSFRKLDVD